MIPASIIAQLRNTTEWRAVQAHIEETIRSLDMLADIREESGDRVIAIEVLARQRAREKLHDILKPFLDYQDTPDTSRLVADRKEDAGL